MPNFISDSLFGNKATLLGVSPANNINNNPPDPSDYNKANLINSASGGTPSSIFNRLPKDSTDASFKKSVSELSKGTAEVLNRLRVQDPASYFDSSSSVNKMKTNIDALKTYGVETLDTLNSYQAKLNSLMTMGKLLGGSTGKSASLLQELTGITSDAEVWIKYLDSTNPLYLAYATFQRRLIKNAYSSAKNLFKSIDTLSATDTTKSILTTPSTNHKISKYLDNYNKIYDNELSKLTNLYTDTSNVINSNKLTPQKLNGIFQGSREYGDILSHFNFSARSDFFWDVEIHNPKDSSIPNFPYTAISGDRTSDGRSGIVLPISEFSIEDTSLGNTVEVQYPRSYGNYSFSTNLKLPQSGSLTILDTDAYTIKLWYEDYLKVTVGNPLNVVPVKKRCYFITVRLLTPQLNIVSSKSYAILPNLSSNDFVGASTNNSAKFVNIPFTILGSSNITDYFIYSDE